MRTQNEHPQKAATRCFHLRVVRTAKGEAWIFPIRIPRREVPQSDPAPNPHLAYIIQISTTPSVLNIAPSHEVIMKADVLRFIACYFGGTLGYGFPRTQGQSFAWKITSGFFQ